MTDTVKAPLRRSKAGRKPIMDKPMDTLLSVRLSCEQKALFNAKGGARWLRAALTPSVCERFGVQPVVAQSRMTIGCTEQGVQAGFPSPAEDYAEKTIDFNDLLVANEAATFVIRAVGHSMINAGIGHGDLLVVDRSRSPKNNDIVIMQINNEFTVKRLVQEGDTMYLKAENSTGQYADLYPQECDSWVLFGVVTFVIKSA